MTQPLEGVRVLDLSTEIAGPYATRLLADAGADVLKVEGPEGDPLRRWKASAILGQSPPLAPGEDGALFRFLNASKRSVVLDLESDAGRAGLLELARGADLAVESFAPGHLDALGLGVEALRSARAGLSLVSITPWGQDGPWCDRPATEFTLQAETGSTAWRGYADRPPVAVGGRLGDFVAGSFAAVGALAALRAARDAERGEHVDVSRFEAMLLSFQTYATIHAQMEPEGGLPTSVEIPSIEAARDGWVGFCTITGQQWKDFCLLIGRPDLGDDDSLLYGYQRFAQMHRVGPAIEAWTRRHAVDEIVEQATLLRIPVSPVGNGRSVLEMDHFRARGCFVENPAGFTQPRVPYRLGRGAPRPLEPAPALGTDGGADGPPAAPAAASPRASGRATVAPQPLGGLRVVDLTAFWAGPLAASVFAALGADVIKVESIQRPDGMRFAGGFEPEEGPLYEWSPIFHGANLGKRGITLDLDRDEGVDLVKRLIARSDLVIENYSPRVLDHFGLGWEAVRDVNPQAILVRMPAFGLDGPWRDRTGFAMTIEQATGLAWRTGYPDRSPLVPRGCCDPLGGMTAVFAALLALEARDRGGGGQLVEVPLVESGLNAAAEQVTEWTAYGALLERRGNRGPEAAPQGVYACADGDWIALAVAEDAQWSALTRALGSPAWALEPDLATAGGRRAAHDRIDAALAEWLGARPVGEAVESLAAAGVPVGRARNARAVRPHPQLEARGFYRDLEHPVAGRLAYPGFPLRFSGAPLPIRAVPPTLGQHNEEVLTKVLDLSRAQVRELRSKGVIGERPAF